MKLFVGLVLALAICHSQAIPQNYGNQRQKQKKCKVVTTVEYEETYIPDCKTVYKKSCSTLYRQKCNDYQDQVCQTVQKRHCDQKRKQECRTEYRTISEPYTEQKCDQIPKCEKTWQQDGYGNKVWAEDKSKCLYEKKCYDVQKQRQKEEPYEECEWKNYEDCYNKPEKSCKYVTKQKCQDEPYEDCKDVPHEECKQIHKQIPKEVKKRVCDNNQDYDYDQYDDVHGDNPYSASDVGNAFVNERKNGNTDSVDIRSGNSASNNKNDDDDRIHFG